VRVILLSKGRIERAFQNPNKLHSIADKNPEKLIEFLFEHPNLVETFLVNAIRQEKWDDILSEYFHLMYDIYPQECQQRIYPRRTNEVNVRKIIQMIKKNHWEKGEWDHQSIYSNDFKEICRTPIYIPFIYTQLLSGEYILHLLHPAAIILQHHVEQPIQYVKEEDSHYRNRCAQRNYARKHEIFFDDKKNKAKPYVKNFEKCFQVSFEGIFPEKYNNDIVQRERKHTVAWQMFDEYAYCDYDLNADCLEKFDMFNVFTGTDELYLNYTEMANAKNDMVLPQSYTSMLLFKTILFQHLRHDSARRDLSLFSLEIEIIHSKIETVIQNFRGYLAYLRARRKLEPPDYDTRMKQAVSHFYAWADRKIESLYATVRDASPALIKLDANNMYRTIFWKLLISESLAIINTIKGTLRVEARSYNEIEKLHQYICAHPNEPMNVDCWRDFYKQFQTQLEEFFPDRIGRILEKDWWLAIKVCLFSSPQELKLRHSLSIPKKVSASWLKQNGIDIGKITTAAIFSTMQVVIHSAGWKVRKKDIKTHSETIKEKIITAQLYRNLDEKGTPERHNQSLRFILENLSRKTLRDPMTLQLRKMIQEQMNGFFLSEKDFHISRDMQYALWENYEQSMKNSDSFKACQEKCKNFQVLLEEIAYDLLCKQIHHTK